MKLGYSVLTHLPRVEIIKNTFVQCVNINTIKLLIEDSTSGTYFYFFSAPTTILSSYYA
jgi:hypothetical protein